MKFEKWLETVPAFRFCITFLAGIIISYEINFNIYVVTSLLIILILLNLKIKNEIYIYVLIFIFGLFKANLDFYQFPRNSVQEIPDSKNFEYTFKGVISDYPQYYDDKIRFIFDSDYIVSSSDSIKVEGKIIAVIYENKFSKETQTPPVLKRGDYIELSGKFSSPENPSNPYEFNYKKYLYMHDIYKIVDNTGYKNIKVLEHDKDNFIFSGIINPARSYAEKILNENYSGDNRGFIKGLVTGDRSDISSETKTSFIDTGVMHILAVSGLNVVYVILLITLCLSILRLQKQYILSITIPLLILYCLFTGATPSIVRATIMGILFITAFLLEKRISFYNIAAVSAIAILIYDSKQFFDAGFVLSYTALLSMVFIYETVFKRLEHKIFRYKYTNNFLFKWFALLVMVSTAAIIGTIPVSASYFGKISLISFIANIIAVPVANFVLATGFIQILISFFSDYLSSVISYTNNFVMNALFYIIDGLSKLKIAYIEFYKFNILNIILTYLILILLATMKKENFAFRTSVAVILFAGILVINYDFNYVFKKDTTITFLDIRNGDAVLISTGSKNLMLYSSNNKTSLNKVTAPFLKRSDNTGLNTLLFANCSDTINSMDFLDAGINVNKTYSPCNSEATPAGNGAIYEISEDCKVYLLSPGNFEANNISAVIKYRDNNIFYLNNINTRQSKEFLMAYSDLLNEKLTYISNDSKDTLMPALTESKIYLTANDKFKKDNERNGLNNLINLNKSGALILKAENGGMKFFDWRN